MPPADRQPDHFLKLGLARAYQRELGGHEERIEGNQNDDRSKTGQCRTPRRFHGGKTSAEFSHSRGRQMIRQIAFRRSTAHAVSPEAIAS